MTQNNELKPCPFCGGEPRLIDNVCGGFNVNCKQCGAKTGLEHGGYKPNTIKAWNTRADTQARDNTSLKPVEFDPFKKIKEQASKVNDEYDELNKNKRDLIESFDCRKPIDNTQAVDVEALKVILRRDGWYSPDGFAMINHLAEQGHLHQPRDNTAALEALLFMNEYAVGNERFQDARYMDFKNAYETIREALKGK